MKDSRMIEKALRQLGQSVQSLGSIKEQVMHRIEKQQSRDKPRVSQLRSFALVAGLLLFIGGIVSLTLPSETNKTRVSQVQPSVVADPAVLDDNLWAIPFIKGKTTFGALFIESKLPRPVLSPEKNAPKQPISGDELLKKYQIESNYQSVLNYLQSLRFDANWDSLTDSLIKQLGNRNYRTRAHATEQLLALPKLPIKKLQQAINSEDAEVSARAKHILESQKATMQIQRNKDQHRLTLAVLETIEKNDIQGLAPMLIRLLSSMGDSEFRQRATEVIVNSVGVKDVVFLRRCLQSKDEFSQISAIRGLGRLNALSVKELRAITESPKPLIALTAIRALAEKGDNSVFDTLLRFMNHEETLARTKATQLLRGWTKQTFQFNPFLPTNKQRLAISKWQAWIAANGKTFQSKLPRLLGALPEDLSQGLLVYYSFDNDQPSQLYDSSGNYFHGMVHHRHEYRPGISGNALWVTGKGDMGYQGGHARFPFLDLTSKPEFTIALWVNEQSMSNQHGEAYIVLGTDRGVGFEDSIGISHFNQELIFRVGDGLIRIPYDHKDRDQWVHYALSFSKGILSAYKQGQLVGQTKAKVKVVGKLAALGRHWWHHGQATSTRFVGGFDEVRIYERALSGELIQLLRNISKKTLHK